MVRQDIFTILETLYPTYAIGQHKGICTTPYLVLKINEQIPSAHNPSYGWQTFKVLCYCPKLSIAPLDNMIKNVKDLLKPQFECTGNITGDFYDDIVEGYTRSIEFRIPKEVV